MKSVPKFILLWLTFLGAILGGIYVAFWPVTDLMNSLNSIPDRGTRDALGFACVFTLIPVAGVVGVYLGDLVWLCVWRFFATRSELLTVVKAGPTTRFDRWLFDSIVPPEAPAAGQAEDPRK
jgi:hypothetical protein